MNKRLTLLLPPDVYRRLEQVASAEDRDPTQQARVILKSALTTEPAETRKPAAAQ